MLSVYAATATFFGYAKNGLDASTEIFWNRGRNFLKKDFQLTYAGQNKHVLILCESKTNTYFLEEYYLTSI